VAAFGVVLALAACGGSSIGTAANSNMGGSSTTIERISAAKRGAPLTVSGTTLDGSALSTAAWRGKVVVLNYWGSWCGPCVTETPDLKAAWAQLKDKDVQFLGLDSNESAATGQAFMQANGLTYPSLQWDGGKVLLQFKGKVTFPPATLVLDQQGRLAAQVFAQVTTATLVGLVEDVQSEASKAAAG
jgi:thiol-disulfide isomerase/thioredoxin